MPANLPPQYRKAEEDYRRAQSPDESVRCLEKLLQLIPKHKGTDHLQADLKTRLKDARAAAQQATVSVKGGPQFRIPRQGAGTVIVLGAPNSGKSRVVAELTNASPAVEAYPFSTREPFPAMMHWQDTLVQLIDTPPVAESYFEPYLIDYVRTADLVVLCFDGTSDDAPEETLALLDQFRTRKTVLTSESGFDENDYATVHVKTLLIVTRRDFSGTKDRIDFFGEMTRTPLPLVQVDLDQADDVERLRDSIYSALNVVRIYTKAPGGPVVYHDPFTLPAGATVEDLAERVHHELAEKLKFARLWGSSSHEGQTVGREHVLHDRDLVELHT
jgi:uncharacterized protein